MIEINKEKNRLLYVIDLTIAWSVATIIRFIEAVVGRRWPQKTTALKHHQQVLQNVFGLTGMNALGGLLMLLTQVKLANTLGASTYGVYAYYLAIGDVGSMIVRYGRNKTMTRDLIQRPERRSFLIANTLALSFINLCLFVIAVIFLHDLLEVEISLAFLLLATAPCLISLDFQPVYEAMRMMSWHSIYNLLQKIIFLLAIWVIIFISRIPTLLSLGIVMFTSWFIVLFVEYKEIRGTIAENFKSLISFRNILTLYRDNFVIALSCLFGVAFGPLIRMILNQYADSKSVGIYSAGLQIFLISQFILNQIGRVGNPMMAEVGRADCSLKRRRSFVRWYLVAMLCSTIPFVIPMICLPRFVTNLFFTAEYVELSNYLPILAIYLITLAIGVVFTQFLISVRADKIYFSLYVLGAVLTVIVSYWVIPHWGVLGAVLSLCVPHGITCLGYALASFKYLKVKNNVLSSEGNNC